jgi:hypothetical protein
MIEKQNPVGVGTRKDTYVSLDVISEFNKARPGPGTWVF